MYISVVSLLACQSFFIALCLCCLSLLPFNPDVFCLFLLVFLSLLHFLACFTVLVQISFCSRLALPPVFHLHLSILFALNSCSPTPTPPPLFTHFLLYVVLSISLSCINYRQQRARWDLKGFFNASFVFMR